MIFRSWFFGVLLVAAALAGCGDKLPQAPATGTYGALTNAVTLDSPRARPDRSAQQPWTNGELSIIQTELSPASLVHSTARSLSFFTQMPETGIGAPTFAAIETQQGPKIFRTGDAIDPARMRESWFVVWWAGATNWTHWDSPWFVTLQHQPQNIRFDSNGLHFTFAGSAGYAAVMPLYGAYKPLQAGHESSPFASLKEKKKRVLTWEWHLALPADPLARAMYWASALKEFPVYCEDSFSVDRTHDSVVLRQRIHFVSWNDDWGTRHLKLAPVSPVLALAVREGLPARFSKKFSDMELFTAHGPYYSVENVDEYTVTLPVLDYVNETLGAGSISAAWSNAPCYQAWQAAHAIGNWDAARARWPQLREAFLKIDDGSWTTFGFASATPLERAANALGAARVAYRLGDSDAYAVASHRFARAWVQLWAQQRGINYFRENQPWKSMEPIEPGIGLARITTAGWEIGGAIGEFDLVGAPDIDRLWRESLPMKKTPQRQFAPAAERLIPGGPATGFVTGLERSVAGPNSFLVQQAMHETSHWPRIVWPDWKVPGGALWNFGAVRIHSNAPARTESIPLNWNTRVEKFFTTH